jgi:hypothetical protein
MAILCVPLLLCGCGNPGSPLPPSLMLPDPVTDLVAARTGDAVSLHWTMPRRTTDRLKLEGDQRASICRALQPQPCTPIGLLLLAPGQPADYTDILPSSLTKGPSRLLRYEVHLENHRKRSAGPSNPAFSAAGAAPPAITAVVAKAEEAGIAIHWQAPLITGPDAPEAKARLLARLSRDELPLTTAQKQTTTAGVPQPLQQTLEAPQPSAGPGRSWGPGGTLDANPDLNRSYRYTVQLAEQLTLSGHVVEIDGLPGHSAILTATDVFPPAVPIDLAVVPNTDTGTIDLSWTAGTDADLAGYIVYRRAAGSQSPPSRVSGAAPITIPAWSDQNVRQGEHYAYSVSAVDTSHNESVRSSEVEAALP